jgi:hypothetical protein
LQGYRSAGPGKGFVRIKQVRAFVRANDELSNVLWVSRSTRKDASLFHENGDKSRQICDGLVVAAATCQAARANLYGIRGNTAAGG